MAGQKSDTRPGTGDWERVGVQVRPHTNTRVASSVSCFAPRKANDHKKKLERKMQSQKETSPTNTKTTVVFFGRRECAPPRPPLLD